MSVFVIFAAAIILLALAFLLRPLLFGTRPADHRGPNMKDARIALAKLESQRATGRLSAKQFDKARSKLALELLDEVNPEGAAVNPRSKRGNLVSAAVIGILIPVGAITLYANLGALELLSPTVSVAEANRASGAETALPSVEELLEKVVARLEQDPDDVEGWGILARSYLQTGRFAEARDAYARLYELTGERPDVLVGYAESMARAEGGDLSGRPTELIENALSMEPENQQALWLAGLASVQRQDKEGAKSYWTRLLEQQAPGSEAAMALRAHIAQLDGEVGQVPEQSTSKASDVSTDTSNASNWVTASISLDPVLSDRVNGDDTLFVYARIPGGPKMPIALARRRADELPLSVRLDDSMAMMPQLKLSNFDNVEVVARISKSGQASQRSGDLIGTSGTVSVDSSEPVVVSISTIVP